MAEETKLSGHPLDRQNAIERAIQLEGSKDPDSFKMPDGRTLTEVRKSNQEFEEAEYQKELQMVARTTRESSSAEFQKGEKLVVTKAGNIIDVTEPKISKDTMTMAESRTSLQDISKGVIKSPSERGGPESPSTSGETATSSGQSLGVTPSNISPTSTSSK